MIDPVGRAHRRCYKAAMSTPIVTAPRNLAQRIANLLRQLRQMREAIEQLEEERFAEGERTMSEAELHDLYEPTGYAPKGPIDRRQLVDQLAAVVAAA